MSIKAKIEAIIYAAEEPVTFEQIFDLVKDEARQELARQRENGAPDVGARTPGAAAAAIPDEHDREANLASVPLHEQRSDAPEESPASVAGIIPAEDRETDLAAQPGHAPELEQPLTNAPASAGTVSPGSAGEPHPEAQPSASESLAVAPAITDAEIKSAVRAALEELITDYAGPGHGIEVRQIAGGYRMATKPEQHDAVRAFVKSLKPPVRLSLPALETLAVIAYKQPITAPEISEIRGVDTGAVLGTLLDRKLITTAGRKQVIGRPILYKTTKEFLLRFGLKDLSELPSMEEFEKLAAESLGADLFIPPAADQAPAPSAQQGAADVSVGPEETAEKGERAAAEAGSSAVGSSRLGE